MTGGSSRKDMVKAIAMAYRIIDRAGYGRPKRRRMEARKLLNMLYLANRYHQAKHGRFILAGPFMQTRSGPVIVPVYLSIEENAEQARQYNSYYNAGPGEVSEWGRHYQTEGEDVTMAGPAVKPGGILDSKELAAVDKAITLHGSSDSWQLINFIHTQCPEWVDPRRQGMDVDDLPSEAIQQAVAGGQQAATGGKA